ncbi:Di-sulfide bridge nucleocytoplasmic transport domain-containing protein [Scheffersomyces amazonensis]|uniref:Di-sulfide bridge nucleocytoplasmic transport domain-containing protein n=1 Tax=Scheffersomyces amazonensis TaxID=1078765 RepID=UPI00315DC8DF
MVDESSSFGFSILEKPVSPINEDGIRSNSTPKNFINNKDSILDSTFISGGNNDQQVSNQNYSTPPPANSKQNGPLQSILKNSSDSSGIHEHSNISFSESFVHKHPEIKLAKDRSGFNTVKSARVLFSPTKEILSYRTEYLSDEDEEENQSYLRKIQKRRVYEEVSLEELEDEDLTLNLTKEAIMKPIAKEENQISRYLSDPHIPYVLSMYLQLFINLILVSIVIYIVYIFITTIKSDVNQRLEEYVSDALHDISLCSREYYRNKCSTEDGNRRVPALEVSCTKWSKCMNRDPQLIGRSKLTAETFADIINGFVGTISWKSIVVLSTILFGSLFITNIAFNNYRMSSHIKADQNNDSIENIRELEAQIREKELQIIQLKSKGNGADYFSQGYSNSSKTSTGLRSPSRVNRV